MRPCSQPQQIAQRRQRKPVLRSVLCSLPMVLCHHRILIVGCYGKRTLLLSLLTKHISSGAESMVDSQGTALPTLLLVLGAGLVPPNKAEISPSSPRPWSLSHSHGGPTKLSLQSFTIVALTRSRPRTRGLTSFLCWTSHRLPTIWYLEFFARRSCAQPAATCLSRTGCTG